MLYAPRHWESNINKYKFLRKELMKDGNNLKRFYQPLT